MTMITLVENDIRKIVRAIGKAISEDVFQVMRDYPMDDPNYVKFMRGDWINENLAHMVVRDGMDVLKFKRNSWTGRLLIDHTHKLTYSITTHQNLLSIPKRHRVRPHFLQTLLGVENCDYQGEYVQQTLFPMDSFEREELEEDYKRIVDNVIKSEEGYTHYVIAYSYERRSLTGVSLEFMDKDFNIIERVSLDKYIKPDYAELTDPVTEETGNGDIHEEEKKKPLVALKTGGILKLKTDLANKEA